MDTVTKLVGHWLSNRNLFLGLFGMMLFSGCHQKPSSELRIVSSNNVENLTNPAVEPSPSPAASEPKPLEDFSIVLAKHLSEVTNRVVEHYNSADEVAYRKNIETKMRFNHQRIMNEIQNGSGNADLLKARQADELQRIEDAHAVREAEWRKKEDAWNEDWIKRHN